MKTVPIDEKDRYAHIAVEDLGDGTCRLYEPGDEEQMRAGLGLYMPLEEMAQERQRPRVRPGRNNRILSDL